jgi:hypothetical protein
LNRLRCSMSALGQKQASTTDFSRSAVSSTADILDAIFAH